jgi:hypothetical protein
VARDGAIAAATIAPNSAFEINGFAAEAGA